MQGLHGSMRNVGVWRGNSMTLGTSQQLVWCCTREIFAVAVTALLTLNVGTATRAVDDCAVCSIDQSMDFLTSRMIVLSMKLIVDDLNSNGWEADEKQMFERAGL